jgi:hypothetical protein
VAKHGSKREDTAGQICESLRIYPSCWESEIAVVGELATSRNMECSGRDSPLEEDALNSPLTSLQEEELSFLNHKAVLLMHESHSSPFPDSDRPSVSSSY